MIEFRYIGSELEVFALAVNWKRYFRDLIDPFLRGSVLEVGAGMGETTRALLNPRVSRWVCVEPDAQFAPRLRELDVPGAVKPEIVVGDSGSLPPHSRFDTILYIDVLEHIRDDAGELARARTRLAPGGYLVILSPAYQFLFSAFDRQIGHERRYTARTLTAVVPVDLRRVRMIYADSVGMLLSLANRLLLKESMPTRSQILFWDRWVIPASRLVDPLLGRRTGRSVIAVYRYE